MLSFLFLQEIGEDLKKFLDGKESFRFLDKHFMHSFKEGVFACLRLVLPAMGEPLLYTVRCILSCTQCTCMIKVTGYRISGCDREIHRLYLPRVLAESSH